MTKNKFSDSAKYYDILLGKDKYEQNAKFIGKILKKYRAKSVLELGCGSGLYLFPLKKNGFVIEGLDFSKKMLMQARKKDKTIRLHLGDATKFKLKKKYDAILCLNSLLVLFHSYKKIEQSIKCCSNHLKSPGLLIIDLPNHKLEIKSRNFSQEYEKHKITQGHMDVIIRFFKNKNKWIEEWIGFGRQNGIFFEFRERIEELIYSTTMLEKILRKHGFQVLEMFGSRTGGRFNSTKSYRKVYICRKRII